MNDEANNQNKLSEKDIKNLIDEKKKKIATNKKSTTKNKGDLTPKQIKEYLDKFVISQEKAKKDIAIAVAYHYKHIEQAMHQGGTPIKKNNVIMLGPTGVGKTYILEKVSQLIDVPLLTVDCSKITKTGYVGKSVDDLLGQLISKCQGSLDLAEKGIVYLDEIDKIRTQRVYGDRDIAGQDVQTEFLKVVEGADIPIQYEKKELNFNTRGVLFIGGGAFPELEKIIKSRKNIKREIGFGKEEKTPNLGEMFADVTSDDLINYGFLPEFIGRFPVITTLYELSVDDLENILRNSEESVIKHYQTELGAYKIKISFQDSAIKEIARRAYEKKIGARGLAAVCEYLLKELKYELPSTNIKKIKITDDLLKNPEGYISSIIKEEK